MTDTTEIIAMALQVGVREYGPNTRNLSFALSELERFVALVAEKAAAKERNLCIHDCRELASHLRCFRDKQGGSIADACAAAIDERGQKEGA